MYEHLGLPAPEDIPVEHVTDTARAVEILTTLRKENISLVSLDTETVIERDEDGNIVKKNLRVLAEGEGPGEWRVTSMAARLKDNSFVAYVFDMGHLDTDRFGAAMRNPEDIEDKGMRPFMWNAPFDRLVLRRKNIKLHSWDLMLGEAILRCGTGNKQYASLANAAERFLGYMLNGKDSVRMDYRPFAERPDLGEDEIKYAAIDAIVTLYLALVIGPALDQANLTSTFTLDSSGQPFITMMENYGLPVDGEGYGARVDIERNLMHIAGEQVALATTAGKFLNTLHSWGVYRGVASSEVTSTEESGLEILHDQANFRAFLTDTQAARDAARDAICKVLGVGEEKDEFSEDEEAVYTPLPFDIDSDVAIRKWISTQLPHFAAAWAVAFREDIDGTDFQTFFAANMALDWEELKLKGERRVKLTKDHDLDTVLGAVTTMSGVDELVSTVCAQLLVYREQVKVITKYGSYLHEDKNAVLTPDWDVNSAPQAKEMFNNYYPDLVKAYLERTTGAARLFQEADSVDKDALKLMVSIAAEAGSDQARLAAALLEFRKRSKTVSTYGDELLKFINTVTGRVHARYDQCLTGTGRLNSYQPNAQNLSPLVKPFVKPPLIDGKVQRILVLADLSQAELRFMAHMAQDEKMLEAFAAGIDLHTRTASLMFGIDLFELIKYGEQPIRELAGLMPGLEMHIGEQPETIAEKLVAKLRQKAKAVAFGYAYGLKGASLAKQLTVQGVPTTKEEADELLRKFDEAYPQVAAWMQTRVDFIAGLSDAMRNMRQPSGVDFTWTWQLHMTHSEVHSAFKSLADKLDRRPTYEEVAEKLSTRVGPARADIETAKQHLVEAEQANNTEVAEQFRTYIEQATAAVKAEVERVAQMAEWAHRYDAAVVLQSDGNPWQFDSRTTNGRRRLFQVKTKYLVQAVISNVVRSRQANMQQVRDGWLASWNERQAVLHEANRQIGKARGVYKPLALCDEKGAPLDGKVLEKRTEDPKMQNDFVAYCLSVLRANEMEKVWRYAMADCIRRMGNMYRNHPIQGGVADAVTVAFAAIYDDLETRFPNAVAIQSVHDSIVVECDVADAIAVRDLVVEHMEAGLKLFCPSVVCKSDGDIALSLDPDTKLTDEQVTKMQMALAA